MRRASSAARSSTRENEAETFGCCCIPCTEGLSDLYGRPLDSVVLREATARIMAAITGLLEELRGEPAPPERFDSRKHGLPETGNFHKKGHRR